MLRGRFKRKGISPDPDFIIQKGSAGETTVGSLINDMGGGCLSSMSSLARLRNIRRLPSDISSTPTMSTQTLAIIIRLIFFRTVVKLLSTVIWIWPSMVPPPTKRGAATRRSISMRGCVAFGVSKISVGLMDLTKVREGIRLMASEDTASR